MKKTLLASAIAAATFSGAVAAQDSNMPSFYGNIQYVYTYSDSDVNGAAGEHADNGTTVGLTHSHAITSGIEGFMKIELEVASAEEKGAGNGLVDLDEAYIGVKGDSFGQVWIGSDDSIYETQLGDYGNWVFEYAGLNPYASATTGEGDLLQYMSPSFGGLTLMGAVQVNGEGEGFAEESYPYQLGATYSMGGLTASLIMDSNDGDSTYSGGPGSPDFSNENSYGVAFEYTIDALVLDAYYDMRSAADGATDNGDFTFDGSEGRSQIGVMGTYNLGPNTFRLAYEMAETDAEGLEVDVLTIQALHNVSSNLYVYTELAQRNNENGAAEEEINQINVGGVYYF
ncbi:porin [Marinobacter halotolerans]|uniref:porin n=1 Tax=Marinobacter halotolerans TaxID=1569211 RepID=UPI001244DDCE|nr:porin [Marinobacter halotolerans]